MSAMKNEIFTACYQLVAAAVNGMYQGILIAILVAATLRILRRTNAATRYAVWFGTLLLLALIIPAHYARSRWDAGDRGTTVETSVSNPALQPDSDDMRIAASSLPSASDGESEYLADDAHDRHFPESTREFGSDFAPSEGIRSQSSEEQVPPLARALIEAAAPTRAQESATPEAGFLATTKQKLSWLSERVMTPFPSWKIVPKAPFFVAALFPVVWLLIASAKASLLVWQLFRIRRLKLNSAEPKPELNARFLSLREDLRLRRDVALRVSMEQRSPVVLGFFKPTILLPADADLATCDHVLRHELAHVRRYDDWANLIQHCIKALFFFHPAILWVSKRISLEREIACDDQVLQSTLRPRAYALLLADLAGRMQAPVLAPGVSTHQSQLKQRIDMILNSNRNTSPRLAKARLGLLATAAAFVAVAAIYLAPRLAFAQSAAAVSGLPSAAPGAAANVAPEAPSIAVAGLAPGAAYAVSEETAPAAVLDAPSALPTTAAVAAGPKFKSGGTISVDVRPAIAPQPRIAILTAPSPGVSPMASVATLTAPVPVTSAPMIASADLPQPGQPMAPRPARRPGRDSSLEERLDRLEKMVESLVAQQQGKPRAFEFSPKMPDGGMNFNWKSSPDVAKQWEQGQADFARKQADFAKRQAEFQLKRADMEKHLAELNELKKPTWNEPKDPKEIKELAEQHAKMAADQAKVAEQAAREAQRAVRDAQRGRTAHKMSQDSRQQIEALHKQHEMLEKRMEDLDRQIEKLERDQEQFEEQRGREQDVHIQEDQSNSNDDQRSERSNKNNNVPPQPAAK